MRKHHPRNERIKREYLTYLEDAKRMARTSVDRAAASIAQFEASTGHRDFAAFHFEQARKFKRTLGEAINPETGRTLAVATVYSRLMDVKKFFEWLAGQPGYRSRLTYSDMAYFNPSNNDGRIAKASGPRPAPTLEQIREVLAAASTDSDVDKRNRALIAFAILSGARDDAVASMRLRHVDPARRTVFHDARQVRTKNRKTVISDFFPVGDDIEAIVTDWIAFLTKEPLFGPDDPLFPASKVGLNEDGLFEAVGLDRAGWRSAAAIRRIFRIAFARAGLPYFHPHSFRTTLGRLGERLCTTPEALKAYSQNLAHESVLTTLTSYGSVPPERQRQILSELREKTASTPHFLYVDEKLVREFLALARQRAEEPSL